MSMLHNATPMSGPRLNNNRSNNNLQEFTWFVHNWCHYVIQSQCPPPPSLTWHTADHWEHIRHNGPGYGHKSSFQYSTATVSDSEYFNVATMSYTFPYSMTSLIMMHVNTMYILIMIWWVDGSEVPWWGETEIRKCNGMMRGVTWIYHCQHCLTLIIRWCGAETSCLSSSIWSALEQRGGI